MSDDGKDDKKKDGEEEEELDCSHPEVVNKYQQAGAVANGATRCAIICPAVLFGKAAGVSISYSSRSWTLYVAEDVNVLYLYLTHYLTI